MAGRLPEGALARFVALAGEDAASSVQSEAEGKKQAKPAVIESPLPELGLEGQL